MKRLCHLLVVALVLALMLALPPGALAHTDALLQAYRQYNALNEQGRHNEVSPLPGGRWSLARRNLGRSTRLLPPC